MGNTKFRRVVKEGCQETVVLGEGNIRGFNWIWNIFYFFLKKHLIERENILRFDKAGCLYQWLFISFVYYYNKKNINIKIYL